MRMSRPNHATHLVPGVRMDMLSVVVVSRHLLQKRPSPSVSRNTMRSFMSLIFPLIPQEEIRESWRCKHKEVAFSGLHVTVQTSEVMGSIYMNLLTGDRYDYLYPLHISISCHWSNSLKWKLVKRPFGIHEPECLNLFYFEHIWCVLLQRKFISTLARKRSFRGILYIALKSTNDCWVVDSTCRIRQRVHIMSTM